MDVEVLGVVLAVPVGPVVLPFLVLALVVVLSQKRVDKVWQLVPLSLAFLVPVIRRVWAGPVVLLEPLPKPSWKYVARPSKWLVGLLTLGVFCLIVALVSLLPR